MATYKSDAGAILNPGNQINRLSSLKVFMHGLELKHLNLLVMQK